VTRTARSRPSTAEWVEAFLHCALSGFSLSLPPLRDPAHHEPQDERVAPRATSARYPSLSAFERPRRFTPFLREPLRM